MAAPMAKTSEESHNVFMAISLWVLCASIEYWIVVANQVKKLLAFARTFIWELANPARYLRLQQIV